MWWPFAIGAFLAGSIVSFPRVAEVALPSYDPAVGDALIHWDGK